jgi:hypothetical protein
LDGELISFRLIDPENADWFPIEWNLVGIFSGLDTSGQGLPFEFGTTGPKSRQEGTAYLVLVGIGEDGGISGNYSLTVE